MNPYNRKREILKKLRELHRGTEKLTELGGFIKAQVEADAYELYPESVVTAVEKYIPFGPGFWDVANAVDERYSQMEKDYIEIIPECFEGGYDVYDYYVPEEYPSHRRNAPSNDQERLLKEYVEWTLDQVARTEAEKIRNTQGSFWHDWDLPRRFRKTLLTLNALDERILFLMSGANGRGKLSAEKIANLPEFHCSLAVIIKEIKHVKESLRKGRISSEEFDQICENNLSK